MTARRSRSRIPMLVLALALFAAACDGAHQAAETTTTTLATTTTTTTTTVPPPEPGTAWQSAGLGLARGFTVSDVAWGAGRVWVIGTAGSVVRLYSSPDGRQWSQTVLSSLGVPEERCEIAGSASLSGTDDEIVVALLDDTPCDEDDTRVWLLRGDGDSWTVLSPEASGADAVPEGRQRFRILTVVDVVHGEDRVVVTGTARWWVPVATSDTSFYAIAFDGDGAATVFARDEAPFGGRDRQVVQTATVLDGRVIVVGVTTAAGTDPPEQRLETWASDDGLTWHRLSTLRGADGSEVHDLVSGPAGLVAVGVVRVLLGGPSEARAMVWHSEDGSRWSPMEVEPGSLAATVARSVAVVEDRYLVFGTVAADPAVWVSEDGLEWRRLQGVTVPALAAVAVSGSRLVGAHGAEVFVSWDDTDE